MVIHAGQNGGGQVGQLVWALDFGEAYFPLVEAKGGPLVKNIDIVKLETGPTFPIWPEPFTSFARACIHV